jgi:hypothetical protein
MVGYNTFGCLLWISGPTKQKCLGACIRISYSMLHGCTVQQKAHIIKVPISNHSKAHRGCQYRPHGASSKTISGWCHGVRCHHVHTPSTEGAERACYVMFVPCVLHVECTHQRSRDGVCLCRRVGDVSKRRNALCFTRRYTGPHTPRKCGLLLASMGMPQRAGNHRRCGTQV